MASDMDREWTPKNRPQSIMAQNFSAALDDLFKIDDGLDNLSDAVFEKQQTVFTKNRELEELEEKLRETEKRLKRASLHLGHLPANQRPSFTARRTSAESVPEHKEEDDSSEPASPNLQGGSNGHREEGHAESKQGQTRRSGETPGSHEFVMVDKP